MKINELVFFAMAGALWASFAGTPTITLITAQQRYPWNGKVDIAVTFTGLSNEVARMDCTFAATNSATQAALAVDHITAVDGARGSGATWTRCFIWDASADVGSVKIDDVAFTATAVPDLGGVQLWENGPYWAECNVGATKPEEYGYYFWWGDTVGYTRNANNDCWVSVKEGTSFTFGNCPTYNRSNSALQSAGYIDSTGNLVAAHDAATANLGAPWRMPTKAEFEAFISNCTTTWKTRNGVYGRLVTGKGAYASKSIFLPAAGYGDVSFFSRPGSYGVYWSSTPCSGSSYDAWHLDFDSGDFGRRGYGRWLGQSVRPLRVSGGTTANGTTHFAYDGIPVPEPSIEVTSVSAQQRYPWNGKVDIAVTFTGLSNEVAQTDCFFAATNSATQVALAVNHVTAVEGARGAGTTWTRHFIWNAAADVRSVKIDDVALTATAVPNLLGGVQLWENGPYWAECNVGASQPEESGYYFWWGDTVGYTRNANNDGWVSVKDGTAFEFSSGNCPTYGKDNSALQLAGYIDWTGNLVAAHDAARAHLGAPWRIPTDAEHQALIDNCRTIWTTRNGVYGRLVAGKGAYASKSIFLPAAGLGYDSSLTSLGSYGTYWSSTSDNSYQVWDLSFKLDDFGRGRSYHGHCYGQSVRPLRGFAGIGASSLCASTHLALDVTSGTRTAAATETIRYSSAWESTDSGATAVVAVNGEVIHSSTGAGCVDWSPTRNGTYTLTHRVTRGGEQVGETLTATFVVDLFPENPVITPASGTTFDTSLTVSMSCPTEGATIRYTMDGSEPTLASSVYKRFRVSGKTTVKARAFDADGRGSEVVTAEYALGRCDDPVIVSAGGTTFTQAGNVVRIDYAGTEGVVRYTRDGSEPTGESPRYTGAFTVDDSTVVKAKVFSDRFFDSQTVTANLVREWLTVATPVITAASTFTGSKTKVVITCATDGALVRYTLNGNDPNSHATRYTGPFYVTAGCTVKAYGVLYDYRDSAVAAKSITKTWGIGDTLGKPDHAFTTGGDAGFVRVTDATAPLGESMKSGAITDNQVSTLETKVTGPGTVSFQWKTSCEEDETYHEWDHAEFLVDGVEVARLDGISGWKTVSARVDGAGEHTLAWRYVKDDVEAGGEDCLWVTDWAWASDFTATQTTAVPVPYAWLLANSRDVVDEYASYEAVAKQMAANGVNTVADCYVAGLDPEDAASVLKAQIELVDGQPVVTPSPDLKTSRVYKVYGRARLDDAEGWTTPVKAEHRFFRVSVEMP